MKKYWEEEKKLIQEKFFFLNHFLVPFLFVYFILMILPQTVPYISFLPNIFTINAFTMAYKGFLFIIFIVYFVLLAIVNKIKIDWRFLIPILVLAVSAVIVILATPYLTIIQSVSAENIVTGYPVIISWTTRLSAIAEAFSNLFSAYVFLVILPKSVFFKHQIRMLAYLFLGFIVFASVYSLVFEFSKVQASILNADPNVIIQSFFDHKNTYGKYLMIGVFLVIYSYYIHKKKWLLILIPFFLFNLFASRCKTGLAIAFFFLIAIGLWELIALFKRHRKTALTISIILGSLFLIFAALILVEPLRNLFRDTDLYQYLDSTILNVGFETLTGRITIYRHVFDLLSNFSHSAFGYGDHLANIFLEASTSFELEIANQTSAFHNGIFDVYAKGGFIRVIAYLAALVYVLYKTAKLWKHNKFLSYFTFCVLIALGIHSMFESTVLFESSAWGFIISITCVLIPLSAERTAPENKAVLLAEIRPIEKEVKEEPVAQVEEKQANRKIGKGALIGYIAILFVAITGFAINPWLISNLGTSRFAIYSLVISLVVMFGYDFGLEDTITRYLTKALANKDQKKANEIIGQVSLIYLIIDAAMLVIFSLVLIFARQLFSGFSDADINIFRYAFLIMAIWSVVNLPFTSLSGILYSYERFAVQKNGDILRRVINLILLIIVLVFNLGIYWVIISQIVASVFIVAYKIVYLNERHNVQPVFVMKDNGLLKNLIVFSTWAFIIAIIEKAMVNLAPSFIGMVYVPHPDAHAMASVSQSAIESIRTIGKTTADYGAMMAAASDQTSVQISLFSIAMQFYFYAFEISLVFGGLFIAKVARMVVRKETGKEFNDLYVKTSRYQLSVILLLIVAFAIVGQELLTIWLGPSFAGIYWVTLLIITPIIFTGPQIILNTMLSATNQLKYRSLVFIGTFIVDVALTLVLATFLGALGAAIGYFISAITGLVIGCNIVYKRCLHVSFKDFLVKALLPLLFPAIITLLAGLLINLLPFTGWIALGLKVVAIVFIYITSLWFFVLTHAEKENIYHLLDGLNANAHDYFIENIKKADTSQLWANHENSTN